MWILSIIVEYYICPQYASNDDIHLFFFMSVFSIFPKKCVIHLEGLQCNGLSCITLLLLATYHSHCIPFSWWGSPIDLRLGTSHFHINKHKKLMIVIMITMTMISKQALQMNWVTWPLAKINSNVSHDVTVTKSRPNVVRGTRNHCNSLLISLVCQRVERLEARIDMRAWAWRG